MPITIKSVLPARRTSESRKLNNLNTVVPDRTNYPLSKANFEKAARVDPLDGPGQINDLVRGPAYVYAILTDKRIR